MDTTTPTAPEALTVNVAVQRLRAAHATVIPLPGSGRRAAVAFGTVNHQVQLIDDLPVVRQLLTDAVAQLDAIEATS